MNETKNLAERLRHARDSRDLSMISDILGKISTGQLVPDSDYEKQSIKGCINSIMGMLRSGTKGWDRSGGTQRPDVIDACNAALRRLKGEEVKPQKDDPAAFRRRRKTGPLKRIPSRETRTGESNAVPLKRR